MTMNNKFPAAGVPGYILLTAVTLALCCLLQHVQETKSQMIPISEVRTHPPEEVRKKIVVSAETDPKTKAKAEVHAKIASSHLAAQEDSESDSELSEESDAKNPKVFRTDKSPQFQNPEKHASESWLLHFLLERYAQNSLSTDESILAEQVDILQNLEHFAHKYENGRDLFSSTNALADILLPALNSSNPDVRMGACSVFAVAAQNNLIVQSKSYQAGVIRRLVHLLTSDMGSVRSKALYALGSLLRNFPVAQQKFIQDGGIPALIKVAFLPETRKRSLTLVTDFLNERKHCDELSIAIAKARAKSKTKIGQVQEDDSIEVSNDPCDRAGLLVNSLRVNGWCNILEDSVKNLVGFGDDEQILIVEAVSPSLDMCAEGLTPLVHYFQKLLVKFEGDEDLAEVVVEPLREIIERLESAKFNTGHTEL